MPASSFFNDAIVVTDLLDEDERFLMRSPQSSPVLTPAATKPNPSYSPHPGPHPSIKNQKYPRFDREEAQPNQNLAADRLQLPQLIEPFKPQNRRRKPKQQLRGHSGAHIQDELNERNLPLNPRRARVLEGNRMAATKCRLRKREKETALASQEYAMQDRNQYLASCFDSLTAEIYQLKTQLFQHTNCQCVLIQKYIDYESAEFVDRKGSEAW